MMLCLGRLPVPDLPASDDCTGCCVLEGFQYLTYPRVTTVQDDVSWKASST
ncbi:hypothetical protein DPMN_040243 [Dreissena polymorpha]|uniref:Uncharacterized protein n=1 Tax=Dreissena polymorpha TaxID=45954 RepID=A0A9D4HV44_DREPO|nr:hypothetical protein DPMN_040243 [Dreissena polymorpha]